MITIVLTAQMKEVKDYITPKKFWSSLHHVDYKFLIIPVVFVFLRVWTGIMNILYLYLRLDTAALSKELNLALLYLSVSDHNNITIIGTLCQIHLLPAVTALFSNSSHLRPCNA